MKICEVLSSEIASRLTTYVASILDDATLGASSRRLQDATVRGNVCAFRSILAKVGQPSTVQCPAD